MRQMATGTSSAPNLTAWQELQAWLATAEHRVVIPYAVYLAEKIPPVAVRLRRDFKALLRLIEAHAMLHQGTRATDDQGRIVARAEDYLAVRKLVMDLLAAGVGATVSQTIRDTVNAVKSGDLGEGVKVQQVATALKLDRSAAQRRLDTGRKHGFLKNLEAKRGQPARYAIGEPLPEAIELLPPGIEEEAVQHTPTAVHGPAHNLSDSEPEAF
jgi:hypothetical protein